jgi:tetratricopeptide (TPR) repeat protein
LETTRAYALEQLAEADGIDAMRRRHAEYFRGLFEDASDDWLRMSDAQWRAIYPPELDNVRWTLDWALRAGGDAALGIALAGASRPVWSTLGLFEEGKRWLEAAVARVEPQTPVSDQARLWFALGVLSESSAPVRSVENFERAIGLYRTLGDSLRLGHALVEVAWPLVALGRLEQCSLALEEAFPMLEDSGLPKLCGVFFTQSGFLKTMSGDLAGARMDYEKALSLYRKSGAESAVSGSLARLAELTWALGDLDAAAAAFAGVVAAMREPAVNRKTTLGYALANLAGVLTERGELDEALAAEREGLSLLLDGGFAWIFADHAALRAALAGNLAYAARLAGFADAVHSARKASREPNEERARTRLHALLREKLAPDKLECLLAEGAKMSEDEACRLALEDCVS